VNFDVNALLGKGADIRQADFKDPRVLMRIILGVLLLANVVAALILLKPWGASPEEMEQRLGQLRGQVKQKEGTVERLRVLVAKSDQARKEGTSFMDKYFMDRRTASSTIVAELRNAADESGIQQKEQTFSFEAIEGSEDLSMMTISGAYEGSYPDLVKFMNWLDRSPRFLILDTLAASPERTAGLLSVTCKLNAFVIDGKQPASPAGEAGEEEVTSE
jgi:type IV pilus assembly protein PilO